MITTIQLRDNIKDALGRMKENPRESFEDVILKLLKIAEEQKRKQEDLIIEGYKEMAEDSLRICNEFKYADAEIECEWNDGNL